MKLSALGEDFRVCPERVGTAGMICVEHVPTGIELIAVPGGSFEMGLTERDREQLARWADLESKEVQEWLPRLVPRCLPAHVVEVSPFLLSRRHLTPAQVAAISGIRTDCLSRHDAEAFATQAKVFRLPSEAELEYAGREGGARSFLMDAGRLWKTAREWPRDSAWGFHAMIDAAWCADAWHDDYTGAPATSAAWTAGGPPGVYRGCLMEPPRDDGELIFALAAARGSMRKNEPGDDWPVLVRVALSI